MHPGARSCHEYGARAAIATRQPGSRRWRCKPLIIDRLDADAHYHVGLISFLPGDLDTARERIETLVRDMPDHLLGLVLSFKRAEIMGDNKAAADARARFMAVYEAAIKSEKPEYEAHRVAIESFHSS